jgi:pyruvate,water dikinase
MGGFGRNAPLFSQDTLASYDITQEEKSMKDNKLVLWFDELELADIPKVGGKNASLGEMRRELIPKGVSIPDGYAITATAYRYLLKTAGILDKMKKILSDLDTHDLENLKQKGRQIRAMIYSAPFPKDLEVEIIKAYDKLCEEYGPNTDVAVRSSATAEDLPDASFAGQQETYLNVTGKKDLIEACKKCFASLFTDRAISYRVDKGFDHLSIALSIGVQKMVRSDLASSGVIFSIDTESGFKDAILITGAYGLGETVVQGSVNPDEFFVFKPTLKTGYRPIIQKKLGAKEIKMVYAKAGGEDATQTIPVPQEDRERFCLTDDEILQLARWTAIIEDHYSAQAGYFKPMDIEWGKDGRTGKLFILQARPETVQSQKDVNVLENYVLLESKEPLVTGTSVGAKIGAGPVNVIKSVDEIRNFKKGEVLVTEMTDPDWEPVMKIAAAIVTNKGGRTCHAAIVSRELGVPCIVGTENGTKRLQGISHATVSCAEGEVGKVYEGILKFEVQRVDAKNLTRPKTKIMLNLGNPENAFTLAAIPNDGVGLARLEFIITNIRLHPMALIQFEKVVDPKVREEIEKLTRGYDNKGDCFVDKLAQGVAKIGAAFYPNDVIVRMSDFKSNEYVNLLGGSYFEPQEENPMIGWRGASRYYDDKYRDGFVLECKAMKKVREEMGLTNVKLMLPFVRTVEEGKRVVEIMKKNGLIQGKDGLEIYMMVEIPSNVILIEEFGKVFDGFSIGSNDLCQLTLGLDRDSAQVAHIFDERNQAVLDLVRIAITKANQMGKKIGICGQAPSDYPEFARFLVECGIDSISLNSDTVIKTTTDILETEKALGKS